MSTGTTTISQDLELMWKVGDLLYQLRSVNSSLTADQMARIAESLQ